MSHSSFLKTILTPVIGESVLRPCFRLLQRQKSCWWSWSCLGLAENVCWAEDDCFPRNVSVRAKLVHLFFLKFLSFFFMAVPPRTPWVHIVDTRRWLEHHLCLWVGGFLRSLFSGVQVSASGIQIGPDRRFRAFKETSDHDLLVQSCSRIKLLGDRLQILQVGCPVKDFLLLVLGVPLKLSQVSVY